MDKDELSKEIKSWAEKMRKEGKMANPTKDHKIALDALQNPLRRDLLKFIGTTGKKTVDEIAKEFNMDASQVKYHLGMLEKSLFVEPEDNSYVLTPRGKGYINDVDWWGYEVEGR
ncbi:MAG TPA: helix-turn-helix transcriptional regulator [Halobacteria archaeon]|jgi:DNA-binding transcriptional ArsR family regulator|nr:helix-turn-helix transcriptional regulator [Halobacteria archaeon]